MKARRKPPKWRTIKCKRCGIEVSTMARQTKYCPDCAYIVKLGQSRTSYKRAMEKKRAEAEKPAPKPKTMLNEKIRAAREAGMSYGKYVAMMEMKKGA